VKKFLILSIFVFVFAHSTGGSVAITVDLGHIYHGGVSSMYPYWAEWGYWNQYPNVFPTYGVFIDTRKNLLQGKILNDGNPVKGKKIFVGKVF
jgi:hypothetical protein